MTQLSLYLLDIAQNSVDAHASLIEIEILANGNILKLVVADNGDGMSDEIKACCLNPHFSTKGSQGMGLTLFKSECERCGGKMDIQSQYQQGTRVEGTLLLDSKNIKPLGEIQDTIAVLLDDNYDLVLRADLYGEKYTFDTRTLKEEFEGISIQSPSVIVAVKKIIKENIYKIGGAKL